MKPRVLLPPLSALLLVLLNGCSVTVWNATRQSVSPNPRGVYTFTLAADLDKKRNVINESIRAQLVIDGQTFVMNRSEGSPNLFTYDYSLPPGATERRYYYILDYDYTTYGTTKRRQHRTPLYNLHLVDPSQNDLSTININIDQEPSDLYQLQSNRGPTGSIVSVSGQGFSPSDRILVGGIQSDTLFETEDTLNFRVPSLNAGKSYPVELQSSYSSTFIGRFFITPSSLRVTPGSVTLQSGESQDLVFSITADAPRGGLLIDVTTDIPNSVIMPEVIIPEGAREVAVSLQGGLPSKGSLFVAAPGFSEFVVPISITP